MNLYHKTFLFIGFLLLFVCYDFFLLFRSSNTIGVDGYYYIVQVNYFLEHGNFYFPTSTPTVLYFFSFLSFIFGDTVLGIKLAIIILQILFYLGVFCLITNLTKNFWLGFLSIYFLGFSGLHLFFISEFLSNLGGLVLLTWCFFGIAKFVENRNYLWLIFSTILFLLSVFSHRSVILLGLVMLISTSLAYFLTNRKYKIYSLLGIIFIFFLPFVLSIQSFWKLLAIIEKELLKIPQIPLSQTFFVEKVCLILIILTTLFLYFHYKIATKLITIVIAIEIWIVLMLINPFLNHALSLSGIIGRFDILSFIQLAILLPLFINSFYEKAKSIVLAISFICFTLLFTVLFFRFRLL